MEIHTTDTPAKMTGQYLSETIEGHEGDVLCLLSGGSAIDVVEFINISADKSECRTIFMMGDDRVSGETNINNCLQLQNRYPEHYVTEHLIETTPNENESREDFAMRMEKKLSEIISELNNLKIISLQGIGSDGHTAGIFPMEESSFREIYREDGTYVPVHVEGLTIDSRASITPTWILNRVDEVILYAVGENKKTILESLLNESKDLHERPSEIIKRHKNAHIFTDIYLEPK